MLCQLSVLGTLQTILADTAFRKALGSDELVYFATKTTRNLFARLVPPPATPTPTAPASTLDTASLHTSAAIGGGSTPPAEGGDGTDDGARSGDADADGKIGNGGVCDSVCVCV